MSDAWTHVPTSPVPDPAEHVARLCHGSHACLLYDDMREQMAAVAPFIRAGLQRGDRCIYIHDDRERQDVIAGLRAEGIDVDAVRREGRFDLVTKHETYLRGGSFDPYLMVAFLRDTMETALAGGFRGLTVTGEMTWALGTEPGCEQLITYEALLNRFFPGNTVAAICQYNRRRAPAAVVRDVLRTHPTVIADGRVFQDNPYFEPTEAIIDGVSDDVRVAWMLRQLHRAQEADEALRRTHAQLTAIVESSEDAIVGTNGDGVVQMWNSAAERIFGYPRAEMIGQPLFRIAPSAREAEYRSVLEAVASGESVRNVETTARRLDGEPVDVSLAAAPIVDAKGRTAGLSLTARDLTARRSAEKQFRETIARTMSLEEAVRELEAFSYSVSHDLRAPLRAIMGFARILLEDHAPQLPPDLARHLRVISENAARMGLLIDDLLRFSRIGRQSLDPRLLDAGMLARTAVGELMAADGNPRVRLTVHELGSVYGDPSLLKVVFMNLLANALKFTRGRAEPVIEIGREAAVPSGEEAIFVRDNGVGFDMRYAQKLFGVFQRLHRAEDYEGTGVGLALVHRIITRHGGRIWAAAAVDQGATFYFTLPAPEP